MKRTFNVSYSDKEPTVFMLDYIDVKNTDSIMITVADTDTVEAEITVKCGFIDKQAKEDFEKFSVAPVLEQGTLKFVPCGMSDTIRTEYRITMPDIPMIKIRLLSTDVHIINFHGNLRAETSSGDIKVEGSTLIDSTLESCLGDIFVSSTKIVNGFDVATDTGDIFLVVEKKEDYIDREGLTYLSVASRSGDIQVTSTYVPVKEVISDTGRVNVNVHNW